VNDERRLAARFAEVSSGLLSESSEDLTFDAVVQRAVELVPGCDASSITLRRRRGRAETIASTDALAAALDAAQYAFGEGPCLDAAFERGSVIVPDVDRESRWPRWVARAQQTDIGSAMAIRLHTARETLGALNLYSRTRGAFDGEAVDIAMIFAAHATDAMSKARLVTGLQAALESRHVIGIAQGVLAVKYDISYERAFEVLHRYSNDTNTKLREVAALVLEERDLPQGVVNGSKVGTPIA
jgi:GAF domain-containing protein